MSNSEVQIERLSTFTPDDAKGIGRLMPFLSDRLSGDPIPESLLREIIASPYREQLVARLDSIIVGTATLNTLMGAGLNKQGNLQDFVTDPTVRGKGVGSRLWEEIMNWCLENNFDLTFTSSKDREAAQVFYASRAEVRDTICFIAHPK